MNMKAFVKKILPKSVLNVRHFWLGHKAAKRYGYPSNEIMVIGVTGTSGKSSVIFYLRQLLERAGYTVGSLSTIDFYIAGENKLNDKKMTMLGRSATQKYLREMVDKKCDIAIVETTSEGRLQYRHRFINYDMMILTNLYPEHIRSHGSFENYMKAKVDLFAHTATYGTDRKPKKTAIINTDHEEVDIAKEFAQFDFDAVYEFSAYKDGTATNATPWQVDDIFYMDKCGDNEEEFEFTHQIDSDHNELNKTIAASVLHILGVSNDKILDYMHMVGNPPGRVEYIAEAKSHGFNVVVDYAFEPVALTGLYNSIKNAYTRKIIHVTGNTGGGRDKPHKKAAVIAKHADVVFVTNEDPYDDNPMDIINEMGEMFKEHGKVQDETLFLVEDRQDAISRAVLMAEKGDIVLVTGKGSEQAMVVKGKHIPWDDREAVRKALKNV